MPDSNAEVMQRVIEATTSGDYQVILADLDPDVEIDDTDIPDAESARGHDAYLKWLAGWDQAWQAWRIEDLEITIDGDVAVALFQMIAKGKGSEIELTRSDAVVASFRGGKITRVGYYNDQAKALKESGLA